MTVAVTVAHEKCGAAESLFPPSIEPYGIIASRQLTQPIATLFAKLLNDRLPRAI